MILACAGCAHMRDSGDLRDDYIEAKTGITGSPDQFVQAAVEQARLDLAGGRDEQLDLQACMAGYL